MRIKIVTLFPEMFENFKSTSVVGRAIEKGYVSIECVDFRTYSTDKHHHVDDTPYGGGAGMVLRCDIIDKCLNDIKSDKSHILLMSPQGKTFNQEMANRLSLEEEIIIVCGHYEGFDERIRGYVDEEVSVGDFVLTGGEIPAMLISDSVIRLLDGAIRKESFTDDSFYNGLLEYPQYTRPLEYKGEVVPEVLQNGNHELIRKYRLKEALRKTYLRRADLLKLRVFSKEELILLDEIKEEEEK